MKLSKDGLLTRFYRRTYFIYEGEETNNFCGFFWLLVLAVVMLPITWWTYRFDSADGPIGECEQRVISGIGVPVGLAIAGLVLYGIGYLIWFHPVVSASVGGVVLVCVGVSLILWFKREETPLDVLEEVRDVIVEKIDAVKEGYCPRIDWK